MEKSNITNNFNAPIIINGGTLNGDIHYHNGYNAPSSGLLNSEQNVREVLLRLMEATDEDGLRIFRYDYQWWSVMRVLSEFCDYPSKPQEFERVISNLNLGPIDHPCKADNFRRVPNLCPTRIAKPNVWLWRNYLDTSSSMEREVIRAALTLMDILGLKTE